MSGGHWYLIACIVLGVASSVGFVLAKPGKPLEAIAAAGMVLADLAVIAAFLMVRGVL